jgi:hypothetical protein
MTWTSTKSQSGNARILTLAVVRHLAVQVTKLLLMGAVPFSGSDTGEQVPLTIYLKEFPSL